MGERDRERDWEQEWGGASPNLDLGGSDVSEHRELTLGEPDSATQAVSMSLTWMVLSRWCPTLAAVFGHQISHGDLTLGSVVLQLFPPQALPYLLRATFPEPRRSHGPGCSGSLLSISQDASMCPI